MQNGEVMCVNPFHGLFKVVPLYCLPSSCILSVDSNGLLVFTDFNSK